MDSDVQDGRATAPPDEGGGRSYPLRDIGRVALTLAIMAGLVLYLFGPWFEGPPSHFSDDLPVERRQVHLYLAFDQSRSVDTSRYKEAEINLIKLLSPDHDNRDRLSCVGFAATTNPQRVPMASPEWKCDEKEDLSATTENYSQSTRFDELFQQVHHTLDDERTDNYQKGLVPQRDLIVIVSDGIPDSERQSHFCPAEFDVFIPDAITRSLRVLVRDNYSQHEDISVMLLLLGNKRPGCVDHIATRWRRATGDLGLEVEPYSADALKYLAGKLGRAKTLFIEPSDPLDEGERSKLDRKETFLARFRTRAEFGAVAATITSARLADCVEGKDQQLAVSRVCDTEQPVDLDSRPGRFDICFSFKPFAKAHQDVVESKWCRLSLEGSDQVNASSLYIPPTRKSVSLRRLLFVMLAAPFLGIISYLRVKKIRDAAGALRWHLKRVDPPLYISGALFMTGFQFLFAVGCLLHRYAFFIGPLLALGWHLRWKAVFLRKLLDRKTVLSDFVFLSVDTAMVPVFEIGVLLVTSGM
jgi:hypothetical protein